MDYTINCPVCGEEICRGEKKCPFCDSPMKNRENIKFNVEFIIPLICILINNLFYIWNEKCSGLYCVDHIYAGNIIHQEKVQKQILSCFILN